MPDVRQRVQAARMGAQTLLLTHKIETIGGHWAVINFFFLVWIMISHNQDFKSKGQTLLCFRGWCVFELLLQNNFFLRPIKLKKI